MFIDYAAAASLLFTVCRCPDIMMMLIHIIYYLLSHNILIYRNDRQQGLENENIHQPLERPTTAAYSITPYYYKQRTEQQTNNRLT